METSQFLAQDRFSRTYITSSEIVRRLGVTRPALHFRKKAGKLPNAITVEGGQLSLWEREQIEPHLQQWEEEIRKRNQ